jgi:nucleotide-binding universal stress UspA family protein
MVHFRTILHPTDLSRHADHALQLACALRRDQGARLLVLHVIPVTLAEEMKAFDEDLEAELGRLAIPDATLTVERRLIVGDPATEILRVAQEEPCDVIVMGTHGRTGLGRLLMGSVAEQVVRRASCPVLTIKIPPLEA